MVTLKTDTLILREFKKSDLDDYRLIRGNPDFQQYYSEKDSTIERSDYLLNLFISQAGEKPRTCYQLALENEAGQLIGSCGIRVVSPEDKMDLNNQRYVVMFCRNRDKTIHCRARRQRLSFRE